MSNVNESDKKSGKKVATNSKSSLEKKDSIEVVNVDNSSEKVKKNIVKTAEISKNEKLSKQPRTGKNVNKDKAGNNIIDTNEDNKEIDANDVNEETKYNTISLKEIREAIENKVDKNQKKSIIKDIIINFILAFSMIIYLVIVYMGSKNIMSDVLEKDLKIITLFILGIGIVILEASYKKDSSKIALNGVETLIFGGANLCIIYIFKLYFNNLLNSIMYIGAGIIVYYILKNIIVSIRSVHIYKKNNSDIKEIIKK